MSTLRYSYFKLVLFVLWLSVAMGCGGQPTEDTQDGGVNGVPRPYLLVVIPSGPANNNNITVGGTATANATVDLYSDGSCTTFVSSTVAAVNATFQFSLAVSDDSISTYYAKQITAEGPSACSTTSVTYVEDSTATAPTLASAPASPSFSNTPNITGTTEANASLTIYSDSGCTTSVASGSANGSGAFSIGISVGTDTTTSYYGRITDAAGNVSACGAGYTYVEDSTAPGIVTVSSASPPGPANQNNPVINGTAEANAYVFLFSDAACTTLLTQGQANGAGVFNFAAPVPDDSTTAIYARAVDAAGNASASCSSTFVTYIEDSGTVSPSFTGLSVGSPTSSATQNVLGTAEASATVDLYTNSSCTSAVLASGTVTGGGTFAISVTVPTNATTTIWGKATDTTSNVSSCSPTPIVIVHDNVAPGAATVTSTSPTSPSNSNTPNVIGTAEASSTVYIYDGAACTTLLTSGAANGAGNYSLALSLSANTTYQLYAKAVDQAGNQGPCSNSITYQEDSTSPATPAITSTNPSSPGNSTTPWVAGTAEAVSTVRIFSDASCSTQIGSGTATGGGTFNITNVTLSGDGLKTFYANATDAATNVSACSSVQNYTLDTTVPATPSISGSTPGSPSNNNSPTINGTAENNATVRLYSDAACTTQIGVGAANGAGAFGFTPTAPLAADTAHTIYAKAFDAATNASGCSSVYNFVEDSTAPSVPTLSSSAPASPSNTNNPNILGSTEANANVFLYSDAGCTTQISSGAANGSGNFTINVTFAADSNNNVYSRSVDAAGNQSACSSPALNYVEDSTAPAAPTVTTSTPYLRSSLTAATIDGTAENNAVVRIYSNSSCSTLVSTGAANGAGNFSVSITAPLNSTVPYYAQASDAAGNTGACSSSFANYEAYTIPSGVGNFTGVQTTAGGSPTNLNQTTAFSLVYNTADFHEASYTHSLSTNPSRIYVDAAGDYQVSLNIPGTGAVTAGALRAEFTVNGTVRSATRAQNYYTAGTSSHRESSISATYLLEGLAANDYIEATILRQGAAGTILVQGKFNVYVEKIDSSRVIFTATSMTGTGLSGGNINTPNTLAWTQITRDSGFTHTNGSGDITLDSVGTYVIHANIPGSGAVANASAKVRAALNGVAITGGEAKQGYISNASGHIQSSMHWSGMVTTVSSNSVLRLTTASEAAAGVVRLMGSRPASIWIERLNSTGNVFYGQGTSLMSGADFNPATASPVTFTTENLEDGAVYVHDPGANSEQTEVGTFGDYLLMFNAQNTGAGNRVNTNFQVTVNGTPISGANSSSFFLRNSGGHAESSGTMVYMLRRLNAGDIVRVQAVRNTTVTTATTNQNTSLILIHKP